MSEVSKNEICSSTKMNSCGKLPYVFNMSDCVIGKVSYHMLTIVTFNYNTMLLCE